MIFIQLIYSHATMEMMANGSISFCRRNHQQMLLPIKCSRAKSFPCNSYNLCIVGHSIEQAKTSLMSKICLEINDLITIWCEPNV